MQEVFRLLTNILEEKVLYQLVAQESTHQLLIFDPLNYKTALIIGSML